MCGFPLIESEEASPYCENCFLLELKKLLPSIRFLDSSGKETSDLDKCVKISGIRLKRNYTNKKDH
jgi:hypothetical protein